MFSDLDASIRKLLTEESAKAGFFAAGEIDVSFEIPNREWSTGLAKPTLNCYLFDIRENLDFRQSGMVAEKNPAGEIVRRRAPVRFDLTYLVTAWTREPEDEHALLWYALRTLMVHASLPEEYLQGELREHALPVLVSVARPDGVLKSPGEFWTAMENQIKPSLSYVVTVAIDRATMQTYRPVATYQLRSFASGRPVGQVVWFGGTVRSPGGAPAPGALVRVVGINRDALTDAEGRFRLAVPAPGRYTLHIRHAEEDTQREIDIPTPAYTFDL
jgi:hypothetical protein